jgi:hypothetical protein
MRNSPWPLLPCELRSNFTSTSTLCNFFATAFYFIC